MIVPVMVVLVIAVLVIIIMRRYYADVYDIIITRRLTTPWYRAVLTELESVSDTHFAVGHLWIVRANNIPHVLK